MALYLVHLAGVLLTLILKVTAGFGLCLALVRLLPNPRHRFITWLVFLLMAGLSWLDLLMSEIVSLLAAPWHGATLAVATSDAREHLTIPASWGIWIARLILLLAAVYLAGTVTLLVHHTYKHLRLRTWLKDARQPSPEVTSVFRQLCGEFNIRRCRLLILPNLNSPGTVYWWTPRVMLPAMCEELVGTPEFENILRHELIHTLRCDYLWATLADLLCALLFFHPAMWQARLQLMLERELACDLAVVEAKPGHRADYADSLARFVRLALQHRPYLSVDLVAPSSFLSTRIRCILTEPEEVPRWKKAAADVIFVTFVVLFASVSPALSISFDVSPGASKFSVEHGPVISHSSPAEQQRPLPPKTLLQLQGAPALYSSSTPSTRISDMSRHDGPGLLPMRRADHSGNSVTAFAVLGLSPKAHPSRHNHDPRK